MSNRLSADAIGLLDFLCDLLPRESRTPAPAPVVNSAPPAPVIINQYYRNGEPDQYEWQEGTSKSGKKRWTNDETGEIRYQEIKPGSRVKAKQEQPATDQPAQPEAAPKAPPARNPSKPGKADPVEVTARLKALNSQEIDAATVQQYTADLTSMTVAQLHQLRDELGLSAAGLRSVKKGTLAQTILDQAQGKGTRADLTQQIEAVRAGEGDAGNLVKSLLKMPMAELKALRAENRGEAGGRSKNQLALKILDAAKRGSLPARPQPGKAYNVSVKDISVDPSRFQYKLNTNAAGVTAELQEVKTFNPDFAGVISVWQDPENGKTYVVNGHHRAELARRLNHPELAVRYISADNAQQARALGALINIAEGRGTAIDAAKFMRDRGIGAERLGEYGVSFKGKLAQDAATLTNLNDRLFGQLAMGLLEQDRALAIAAHLPDPGLQDLLVDEIEKTEERSGRDLGPKVVAEMAREVAATPLSKRTEKTLFGDEEVSESLFVPRNELKAYIRGELAKHARDFEAVASARRAANVAGAGNILNTEENKRRAETAEQAKNVFDALANYKGHVSDVINEYASQLALNTKRSKSDEIKRQAAATVKQLLLQELAGGDERGGAEGTDQAGVGDSGVEQQRGTGPNPTDAGGGDHGETGLSDPSKEDNSVSLDDEVPVEALPPEPASDGTPKEPWEMTRSEWVDTLPKTPKKIREFLKEEFGVENVRIGKNPMGTAYEIVGGGRSGHAPASSSPANALAQWLEKQEGNGIGSEPTVLAHSELVREAALRGKVAPKRPGFTGTTTDALGREYHWVDGKRVATTQKDAFNLSQHTASVTGSDPRTQSAQDRYNARDQFSGGGLFGGEDLRAREGFARLPDGAPVLITEGQHAGKQGVINRETGPDGRERIVARVDGVEGNVPVSPTAVEPLQANLSWRTDSGSEARGQGGLFGGLAAPVKQDTSPEKAKHLDIQRQLNAVARSGKSGTIDGVEVESPYIGTFRATIGGKKVEGDAAYVASRIQEHAGRTPAAPKAPQPEKLPKPVKQPATPHVTKLKEVVNALKDRASSPESTREEIDQSLADLKLHSLPTEDVLSLARELHCDVTPRTSKAKAIDAIERTVLVIKETVSGTS